jgi:hypothetical protein
VSGWCCPALCEQKEERGQHDRDRAHGNERDLCCRELRQVHAQKSHAILTPVERHLLRRSTVIDGTPLAQHQLSDLSWNSQTSSWNCHTMDDPTVGWMQDPRRICWHRVRRVEIDDGMPILQGGCGLAFTPDRELELQRPKTGCICTQCIHAEDESLGDLGIFDTA